MLRGHERFHHSGNAVSIARNGNPKRKLTATMAFRDFVQACEQCVENDDHYAALALALAIPEICAAVVDPGPGKSRARYIAWWLSYVTPYHTYRIGGERLALLTPEDAYLLRCSFLHAGTDILEGKRSGEVLDRVAFTTAGYGNKNSHLNRINGLLQLDVAKFVGEVLSGVSDWLNSVSDDVAVQDALSRLISIHDMRKGPFVHGVVSFSI